MLESAAVQQVLVPMPAAIVAHIDIAAPPTRHGGGALDAVGRDWPFRPQRLRDSDDPEGKLVQFRVT